jgi:hypothetical protein
MKRILFAVIITALAIGPAITQETCASKAVGKNGKQLGWCRAQQLPQKMQAGGMLAKGGERGRQETLGRG